MKKFLSILLSVALIVSCASTTAFAAVTDTDDAATVGTLEYKIGDVNADGNVTVADAKMVLKSVAGEIELDETQRKAADVTLDNNITVLDAKWILQVVAGLRELTQPAVNDEPFVEPDGSEMQKLADAIDTAKSADTAGYTAESIEALENAISQAEDLLGKQDVTASQINQAIEDMQVAQAALKTDVAPLEDAVRAAYTKDTTGYSIESVDAYFEAVAEAEKVLANKNATPDDIATAVASIEEAEGNLKANKSELASAIAKAEAVDTNGMSAESKAAFDDALANAKTVMADDKATAEQVAAAISALASATSGLTVDKTTLNDKISDAEALDLTGYTTDSKAAVTAAINTAKAVNDDANATAAQVLAAINSLDEAVAGLEIDTADFDAAYTAATAITNSGYTSDTSAALTKAIEDADELKANADATVADYAAVTQALETAVAGLEADLTALNTSIATAEAKNTTGYTADTVAAYDSALADAKAITVKNTPAEVLAAKTALDEAVAGLEIDTADFDAAYTTATAIDNNGYTAVTSAALTKAIEDADELKANADATVADYAAVTQALKTAISGLEADLTALNTSIATAEAKNTTGYTASTVAAYDSALADAKAITVKNTPAEVSAAKTALDEAVAGLKADLTELEALITIAEAKVLSDYTSETAAALSSALANANAITEDNTPAEVLAAKTALDTAIKGLVSAKADTTALETKIAAANTKLATADYTDETAAALIAAITAGQAVVDSAMPTTEQVTNAISAIDTAMSNLVSLDSALADKKAEAVAIDTTGYTAASVTALTDAIAQADTAATADQKKAAIQAIDDAIAGLTVDKSVLEAKITDAEAIDTTGYTAASVTALTTAINDAKTVKNNAAATVAEVSSAVEAINEAVSGLKADKTALEAKIDFAKSLNMAEYTDTSAAELTAKITAAQAVVDDDSATVEQVKTALSALTKALRELEDNLFDNSERTDADFAIIDWR